MNEMNTEVKEKKPYTTAEATYIPLQLNENIAASGQPVEPEEPAFKPFFIIPTDEDIFGF